jgi:mannose/cellobiose epimerase-like protein (N-acyl-D-glucosamine 2-epimerase family)
MAWRQFGGDDYQAALRHGVAFLRDAHRNPATGGYAWQLKWNNGVKHGGPTAPTTATAWPSCCWPMPTPAGGRAGSARLLDETFELMEQRFWLPEHGLYADVASADWSTWTATAARTPTCTPAKPCWPRSKRRAKRATTAPKRWRTTSRCARRRWPTA